MRRSFLIFLLTLLLFSIGQVGCRPTSQPSNSNNANVSRSPLQGNNGSSSAARISFDPSCRLPFQEIQGENLPIDQQCGKDGTATHDSSNAKQNEVKNNFCATGVPVELTFANFDQLQETADIKNIPYGSPRLLDDRSILAGIMTVNNQAIGEGSVVTLVGFVFDARHSNTKFFNEEGESVNCKSGELGMNDIHSNLRNLLIF
jgi:hypothetical protein